MHVLVLQFDLHSRIVFCEELHYLRVLGNLIQWEVSELMLVLFVEDVCQSLSQCRDLLLGKKTLTSADEVKLEHRVPREHILQVIVRFLLQQCLQFAREDLLALLVEE